MNDVGLVLAGGGAKGAYQVGAIFYLAEVGISPLMIAGTSIGALNGAVLASNDTLKSAADKLYSLWSTLAEHNVLQPNARMMGPLLSYVLTTPLQPWISKVLLSFGLPPTPVIFDPKPIEIALQAAVHPDQIRNGKELWVTVFPSIGLSGLMGVLMDCLMAAVGKDAEWYKVNDITNSDVMYQILLASAAIPLAFPRRYLDGRSFVDGGLADNVPIRPLVERGCETIIVINTSATSLFSRGKHLRPLVIEIRPSYDTESKYKSIDSMLDFSTPHITYLIERGYNDAKKLLNDVSRAVFVQDKRVSEIAEIHRLAELMKDDE